MRFFTLKRQMLFAMFVVFGCLAIHAADDDLITKQITVKLDEAGTLPDKIGSSKKYKITNLKIVGEINGTDLRLIRDMAGCDCLGASTKGKLAILDLVEAKIVEGGYSYYLVQYYNGTYTSYTSYNTSNDCLGAYVFYGCIGLTSLSIPSSVASIGSSAFSGCSSLTSLSIPSSVASIGSSAFYNCIGLTSLSIPFGVTSIGAYAFYGCSGLTSLTLPSGVTVIGDYAFSGCSGLTSLTLPSGVTSIGYSAFRGCSGLTSLSIPSSVNSIGNVAFYDCTGLTSVYVYTGKMPKMGTHVFDGCDAEKCILYVPKGTYDDYWLSEFGYFDNIVEFDVTGIDKVTTSTDTKEISRYSLNGQRLSAPAKGLNIVKYSDGSVRKVVVL